MQRNIVNPRLTDVLGLGFTQDDVNFAIPRLMADIPLYVDPFLLFASSEPRYRELHNELVGFFAAIAENMAAGRLVESAEMLAGCIEPREMGLGYGFKSRRGSNIGPKLIAAILDTHKQIPQLRDGKIRHLEELQLVVPLFAEDRTSDTACAILKPFFIDHTMNACAKHGIPTRKTPIGNLYDHTRHKWVSSPEYSLPFNPIDGSPILFAPLNLLRKLPWINYDNYYDSSFSTRILNSDRRRKNVAKEAVLEFNARHYVEVERYVTEREKRAADCRPDPLFNTLSTSTIRAKEKQLRHLPTGSVDGADRTYEDLACALLSTLLYPTLELAESRVRTISGAHIRDLIFYNDAKAPFWADMRERYEARQPVFELKNVRALEPEHVNQLYRYLDSEFGRFGVLVTRAPPPASVARNIVDLHSSKRVTILVIDDRDIDLMVSLLESNRDPGDVVKKKFVEFTRLLPK